MRSQATKTSPKKKALSKAALKANSSRAKKPVAPKKVKKLVNRSLVKNPNKKGDDNKNDGEVSGDTSTESVKSGSSKNAVSRSNSPTKKSKAKDKKDPVTTSPEKKIVAKKVVKPTKKPKAAIKAKLNKKDSDNEDVKYKINLEVIKNASKFSKAKNVKKNNAKQKKKCDSKNPEHSETEENDPTNVDSLKKDSSDEKEESENIPETQKEVDTAIENSKEDAKLEEKLENIPETTSFSTATNITSPNQPETPKTEHERPPKFFTSTRSPRMVDIDVKCFKTSKGNLSVSERFLSMKCETKSDDVNKEKSLGNTLVSQGPEIDVYTFTEKVDSPKSILSDFRNPINKNIGRVRPIARVKGTVIDKKTDSEKKKYSPHRPIEEVVKQLKANKRSEELNTSQSAENTTSSVESTITSDEKQMEDKPKQIISKSYKMVARKSSITGQPFSPTKFLEQESVTKKNEKPKTCTKKTQAKSKKKQKNNSTSDDEFDSCKFSFNTKNIQYTSSEESSRESNDDDTKESSGSDTPISNRTKTKKYKRITDSLKKTTSKELKELSKDSLIDLKDDSILGDKPSKRRLKLLSMWAGPKKHRMASLNAIAKVHCLYENESRTHMELGLMKTVDRAPVASTSKAQTIKKKEAKPKEIVKPESTSESEYEAKKDKKEETSESSDDNPAPQRSLRGVPGIRSAGKYWDPKSSTSSSEDSELESKKKTTSPEKKKLSSKSSSGKSDTEKPPAKMKKTAGVPVKKKRNRNEVVMDLKDMVVQKRMASLNATAILAASYEKRSPKSSKDGTTSDSCSDESFSQKSKNGVSSGVKSEIKIEDTKKETEDTPLADRKQKVEVIVNQDTDVTITGMYATHHHEGFCTVSGMQYRISSTSHTQTTATANCEKEGCPREGGSRYTPLTALSSMQPPAEHAHSHPHPVPELGGLARRAGCSSAFSAPSPSAHHEPGYYQPAGPLIKESGADAERALARYHPPPHYHPPHAPVLQQYGPPYYPDLCYGRYYRPPGPYHMPPQQDAQMVGVGSEPYPPPPYYGTPPCYQHSPQRVPYVEYRGCPCPLNACPKNVHIGPVTGRAPTSGGPGDVPLPQVPPGGAFRTKVRVCALDAQADTHGSGKDPPLESEPPAGADAPHPCPVPAIGGASPKRELFDVRDNLRIAGDTPGPAEALGPPSPARGSAGACAPQPPPVAPRRARLGKEMARRSLVGDDTALLLSVPQPPRAQNSDADDEVVAISPPLLAAIDLSSSDERSTPLVDVKKENEGPTYASPRKSDAQALKENNNCTAITVETSENTDATKAVKRRYSRPKLEIDAKNILEESCKTNGIGEHVKLQKRRKVSCEQSTPVRTETITKEPKKKAHRETKLPKTPNSEKKSVKRKSESNTNAPRPKKIIMEPDEDEDCRLRNVVSLPGDDLKLKTKSALMLDNLLRKNSIDRVDNKGYTSEKELNPAELFLPTSDKKININNNIVESKCSGVQPDTIAAVSQMIEKKLKNACKMEKVDSKITHSLKSVLKSPTDKLKLENPTLNSTKCKLKSEKDNEIVSVDKSDKIETIKDICESTYNDFSDNNKTYVVEPSTVDEKVTKPKSHNNIETNVTNESHSIETEKYSENDKQDKLEDNIIDVTLSEKVKRPNLVNKPSQLKNKSIERVANLLVSRKPVNTNEINVENSDTAKENTESNNIPVEKLVVKRCKLTAKANGEMKTKSIEKVAKLLISKRTKSDEVISVVDEVDGVIKIVDINDTLEKSQPEKILPKRCKLTNGEMKAKNVEKVVKLLVSKKPAIKTDEATLVVEDACASPVPTVGRRRRRSGAGTRRVRRQPAPLALPSLEPRAPPRWSNGWNWDGEHYISKVYLSNDSRLDRTAKCWSRMTHASGDSVARGDCVLLRASTGARAQPFVARVASLWENPEDGEMMVSLVWYYRPEHTERGREPADAPDEVFASRHRDANSVACIEDKCYVLTFNEYCRYRKRLKAQEEGVIITPSIVPPLPASEFTSAVAPNDCKLPRGVSPELVLFCRKIYDYRSRKIQVPNK